MKIDEKVLMTVDLMGVQLDWRKAGVRELKKADNLGWKKEKK